METHDGVLNTCDKLVRCMMEYGRVGMEGSEVTSWRELARAVNILGFRPTHVY